MAGLLRLVLAAIVIIACFSSSEAVQQQQQQQQRQQHRFAVVFSEQRRASVRAALEARGYAVVSEGEGFFAVTAPSELPPEADWEAEAEAAAADAEASDGDLARQQQEQLPPPPRLRTSSSSPRARARRRSSSGSSVGGSGRRRRLLLEAARRRERERHLMALHGVPGVRAGEVDPRRRLHASRRAGRGAAPLAGHWHLGNAARLGDGPAAYDAWGSDVSDKSCAAQDEPQGAYAGAEVVPWGVRAIGALNATVQAAPQRGRVIVCVIDSGIWTGHPEFNSRTAGTAAQKDRVTGCGPGPTCPFRWYEDEVSHGTHVAGTVAAPRNGLGVVGVIPGGAELYVVRVWNETGDVSQGQGPFATDLVLAYDRCRARLDDAQAKEGGARVRMVINMSYGSAGPLTVERLWMERNARRGDMLFVASAGNNGSWLAPPVAAPPGSGGGDRLSTGRSGGASASASDPQQQPQQQPQPLLQEGQYWSYPASYGLPEVLSVANMRCDGSIDYTSQKNRRVGVAAPGMAVLSSVPQRYAAARAALEASPPLLAAGAPSSSSSSSSSSASGGGSGGGGSFGGQQQQQQRSREFGIGPDGFREPRPIKGTRVGSSGLLPAARCDVAAEAAAVLASNVKAPPQPRAFVPPPPPPPGCPGASGAACLVELPGRVDWYTETCLAMLKCVRGGGKALVLWRSDALNGGGGFGSGGAAAAAAAASFFPALIDEYLLGTQLNCGAGCGCWRELQAQLKCGDAPGANGARCGDVAPPGVVVSARQGAALAARVAAAAAPKSPGQQQQQQQPPLRVNVTNYSYPYRHYDGTSMAAPHVSAAATLLWRVWPKCGAGVIARALKESAQRLPAQTTQPDLAAGHGLVRVDRAYDWLDKRAASLCA